MSRCLLSACMYVNHNESITHSVQEYKLSGWTEVTEDNELPWWYRNWTNNFCGSIKILSHLSCPTAFSNHPLQLILPIYIFGCMNIHCSWILIKVNWLSSGSYQLLVVPHIWHIRTTLLLHAGTQSHSSLYRSCTYCHNWWIHLSNCCQVLRKHCFSKVIHQHCFYNMAHPHANWSLNIGEKGLI